MVRAQVYVTGRVQGVFFRAFTRERALALGLTGWVKNLPDGSVEIVCEGEDSSVASLLKWCRKGPPAAHVTDIEAAYAEPTGEFDSFVVEYSMRW